MDNSNSILIVVAIIVIAAALLNLGVTVVKRGEITAKVTEAADVNLSIDAQANIEWTTAAVEWGNGTVSEDSVNATIASNGTVTGGTWGAQSAGLVLQNNGNVNVTLTLAAGKTATAFLGTGALYRWSVTNTTEAGSCVDGITSANINETGWTDTATGATEVCNNYGYDDDQDVLDVNVYLVIPEGEAPGVKSDTITAAATANV